MLWIRGNPNVVHDCNNPDCSLAVSELERFAHCYREARGDVDIMYINIAAQCLAALTAFLGQALLK